MPEARMELGASLDRILARSYVLYSVARRLDRQASGKVLHSLGGVLRFQCVDLALAVDQIAERIRELHLQAPRTRQEVGHSEPAAEASEAPTYSGILDRLIEGHADLLDQVDRGIDAAERAADEPTRDLLMRRRAAHAAAVRLLRIRRGLSPRSAMLLASPRLMEALSALPANAAGARRRAPGLDR